jgi:hypothetical protein
VFPRDVTMYLEVPAACARPRQTVSRQRKREDGRMIDNAIERRTDATTRFETSWLIVRDDVGAGGGPPEVLTLGAGGGVEGDGTILPVFSFEEEALLYLRLCGFLGGWHASKSGIADLASVLSDTCPEVRRVALDPIPEIGPCGPHDLVSLSREEFLGLLAAGR